ncbi:MAG: hydroxyethylthiazole kinase [Tuberibacillus sp.]
MDAIEKIGGILSCLKSETPLIHHITNTVTINDCANITLAVGASPVMAIAGEEAAEMAALSQALVLNIGTLTSETVKVMCTAGKAANKKGIPVVFDPVGVGATRYRLEAAKRILKEVRCSVIRGNISEIKSLAGFSSKTRGVDAVEDVEDREIAGKRVASDYNCIVAITGKTDIITDGHRMLKIKNGHPLLRQVTGTGCMTTSLTASMCAVTEDYFHAAAGAVLLMGLSGEKAFRMLKEGEGLGMFRARLIDAVSTMKLEDLLRGGRIDVESQV